MKTVALRGGEQVPAFGLGTWHVGDSRAQRADEIAALQRGLDLGARLIDTAEMYGEGKSEEVVAEAIEGRRDDIFLVSKVLPQHATRRGTVAACEQSLRRLRTDRLDLYLLHWRGSVPLAETLAGFDDLQRAGRIRFFGVSNLDLADMQEWWSLAGGDQCVTNQLLYNLSRRGIEGDLLPWLLQRQVTVMAYSPIEQARLLRNRQLVAFARDQKLTPAQVALAWLLAKDGVIVIPKSSNLDHLEENLGALRVRLTAGQLAELDKIFPPPAKPTPLEML